MPYEIPPEFEPHPSQIPPWAHDVGRFRIMYAITLLIAQRFDPIFCKQLYDDPDFPTGDDIAEPKRVPNHPHF